MVTPVRRALLAWEFGAGRTHAVNLLGVAKRLRAAGVECLATLYDLRFAEEFSALAIPAIQNYVWPARRRAPLGWREREVRSLGDVLANLGVAHPDALRSAIAHYQNLFYLFRPDVILAETAFGAILAARGRIPVIAFGNAPCLPPLEGNGFALRAGQTGGPSWPNEVVAQGISEGLALCGRPGLARLSDILAIEGLYPYGPAAFDLYGGKRATPVLPPYLPDVERPVPLSRGEEIFAYLHDLVQGSDAFMQALHDVRRPMRLFIPGLSKAYRDSLGARGVVVEDRSVPASTLVARARCVLHHGGTQLTTLCLAAGVPQLVLAKELDNELCGRFVVGRGLGVENHVARVTADWVTEHMRAVFDDDAMKRRALEAAPEFAEWIREDPSKIVARAALEAVT